MMNYCMALKPIKIQNEINNHQINYINAILNKSLIIENVHIIYKNAKNVRFKQRRN